MCHSTPICFSAKKIQTTKPNTRSWFGEVLLRIIPCTPTREAVLVGSGTTLSQPILIGILDL